MALLASAPQIATSVPQPAAECSAQLTINGAFLNANGKVNIDTPLALLTFPHCILVVFGGENYGEYARSLKRFAFIAIQYLRWLWAFWEISNSGITLFSSDLLETVVTTTKSQNI